MCPKVSTIVSIYNIENYVEKCIDSLIGQTLKEIEIILVDDGSSDECTNIMQNYALQYPNIIAIHKENGGLSSARNAGLAVASGEYCIFLDGDDWIADDMLNKLYQSAKSKDSDMVMCSYYRVIDKEIHISQEVYQKVFAINEYRDHDQIIKEFLYQLVGANPTGQCDVTLNMCVWRNLYRTRLIREHNVIFESERQYISEDIIFHLDLFPYINSVTTVPKPLYYYRFNQNSLTKRYHPDRFDKECYLYQAIQQRIPVITDDKELVLRANRSFIGRARSCITAEVNDNKKQNMFLRLKNIQRIVNNENLKGVLKKYPIKELPFLLRVVTWLMKMRCSLLLYMIFGIKRFWHNNNI